MSEELEPITSDAVNHAPATTTLSPDAPRLPDAVPGEVPAPALTEPVADPAAVELDGPAPPEKSGTPVGFFVLMLLIVGAIVAIGAIVRPWESAPEEPASVAIDEPTATAPSTTPATTPATTSPSTAPPATTAPTAEAAVTADTTTTLVVGALPQPTPTASIERVDTEALFAEVERCRTEQRIVFVSLQAFVNETGAHPSGPDSLAANGWLEPHPDGWSPRWAFDYSMEGIAVVPVAGGECDL